MIANRLAKDVKCPLMSGPVMITGSGYQLFKAPCMGPDCAFAHVHTRCVGEDKRLIKVLYCKYLTNDDEYAEIGEIDETTTQPHH